MTTVDAAAIVDLEPILPLNVATLRPGGSNMEQSIDVQRIRLYLKLIGASLIISAVCTVLQMTR